MSTVLDMVDVRFGYDPQQPLLRIDALSLEAGESALLSGPSGSGKSTLLGLIGGVLQPD
ncbi:MAG: ATP-binding cassette domain-containing protein, partial [Xanthomonadales bacterium]|nr:ATP-binding cassette domain-containing protein [Xanthomonadales bacterium]